MRSVPDMVSSKLCELFFTIVLKKCIRYVGYLLSPDSIAHYYKVGGLIPKYGAFKTAFLICLPSGGLGSSVDHTPSSAD